MDYKELAPLFTKVRDSVAGGELDQALDSLARLFEIGDAPARLVDEQVLWRGKLSVVEQIYRRGQIDFSSYFREWTIIGYRILELCRKFESSVEPGLPTTEISPEELAREFLRKLPLADKYHQIHGFEDAFQDAVWRVVAHKSEPAEFIDSLSGFVAPNEAKGLLTHALSFLRSI